MYYPSMSEKEWGEMPFHIVRERYNQLGAHIKKNPPGCPMFMGKKKG